jgi:predicted nucleotidyltransferase component of viral defense system
MSEDVDFKIVLEEGLSTSARRNLLSRIKKEFAGLLDETDFSRSDFNAGNNNSHFSLNVGYQTLFETTATLRPEIKVEFTTSSTALPPQLLTATTLIGDLIPEHQAPVELLCLSLEETAAEKVVSFLRRSLPYFREFTGQYEGQLVRHIYDVHMLSLSQIDLSSARPAAEHAFTHDALRYANTSSVFATEPREELLTALTKLDKEEISQNYDLFVADLLSNEGPPLDEALDSFIRVAHALLD